MQLNDIFLFIYGCFHGGCRVVGFSATLALIWLWIIIVGYALSVIALFSIVYSMVRLHELREREEKYYSTVISDPATSGGVNPRWQHIESLANGASASEWREAIIEADIMLDDALARQGYIGDGVGEKLKSVEPSELTSLNSAWEAHKVRNQIAHEGSAFDLSEPLARRTIAHYESVFRELKAL